MAKVLFLDVDGVLNCTKTFTGPLAEHLDIQCLNSLARIVEETGCLVVLSSTWRRFDFHYKPLIERLKKEFNIELYDKTPFINKFKVYRSEEIQKWLDSNQNLSVTKFAILDDDLDAGIGLEHSFFKTSRHCGLDAELANKVIHHLNERCVC